MNEVDEDLQEVLAWKRAFSEEVSKIPPEKRAEYINRQGEKTIRELGLNIRRPAWYRPPAPETAAD